MRRAAPRLVPALGLALVAVGAGLLARGRAALGDHRGLEFLSPEQYARFQGAPAQLWAGAAVGAAGLLLLAALAGRLLGRRAARPRRRSRAVLAVVAGGALLVVAGVVVALTTAPEPVVTYTGSYTELDCADGPVCDQSPWPGWLEAAQQTGLGTAVLGAGLLAGVSGWWRGSDRRADQQ